MPSGPGDTARRSQGGWGPAAAQSRRRYQPCWLGPRLPMSSGHKSRTRMPGKPPAALRVHCWPSHGEGNFLCAGLPKEHLRPRGEGTLVQLHWLGRAPRAGCFRRCGTRAPHPDAGQRVGRGVMCCPLLASHLRSRRPPTELLNSS